MSGNQTTDKTIYVVEDDPAILEVIEIILSENGYKVLPIADSTTLQKKIEERTPSLILMDIWMSGLGGKELTIKLKSNPITKSIPVILMSAHNDTEKISKEAGADGFLLKPFNITDLIELVQKHNP